MHYDRLRRTGAVQPNPRRPPPPPTLALPDLDAFRAAYGDSDRLGQWRGVQRMMILDAFTRQLDTALGKMPLGHTLGYLAKFDSQPYRRSRTWTRAVLNRDGHRCRRCASTEYLHAHHIVLVSERPDLAEDLDNGITLCATCHALTHTEQGQPELAGLIRRDLHGQP